MLLSRPRSPRPLGRSLWIGAALAVAAGCGGKVVFADGGSGGAGGSGGTSAAGLECVLGNCNDFCNKCVGAKCFTGKCDTNGTCQPPDVTFTCGK